MISYAVVEIYTHQNACNTTSCDVEYWYQFRLCFQFAVLSLLQDIDGRNTQMKKYKGKVVLAVNVASQCGFTKQYQVQGKRCSGSC